MSSIGVTGNNTSSGGSGRCDRADAGRGASTAVRRLRLMSMPMLMAAAPQDDQAELGEACSWASARVRRTVPYDASRSARRIDHGRQFARPGPPSVSCPLAPRGVACSAHQAAAAVPRAPGRRPAARPARRATTDQPVDRQVEPGKAAGATGSRTALVAPSSRVPKWTSIMKNVIS